MNQFRITSCLLVASFVSLHAQELISSSASSKPIWLSVPPNGYLNDYYVGEGENSTSLPDASKEAIANAIKSILRTRSFEAKSSFQMSAQQEGNTLAKRIVDELVISGTSQTIKGLVRVESYYETWNEPGGLVHRSWVLVKVPKTKGVKAPPGPFAPVWRSAIGPGWGQFFKGEPTKGYVIAISLAALIPTGIVFDNLKATAKADARNARTQALQDYYVDQANTYKDLEVACFSLAAAMYLYNIVDAIVSDGERVYVDRNLLLPQVNLTDSNLAVSMRIHF